MGVAREAVAQNAGRQRAQPINHTGPRDGFPKEKKAMRPKRIAFFYASVIS
jgi:hypothetical protein